MPVSEWTGVSWLVIIGAAAAADLWEGTMEREITANEIAKAQNQIVRSVMAVPPIAYSVRER
jgi:hypothetical protein